MKYLQLTLVFLVLFSGQHLALDAEDYVAHVQALSRNETFLDAYADWAFALFSKPDYLYGDAHRRFPCPIEAPDSQRKVPVSVHSLRPSDVNCVAALGDSLTTGLAAQAITPNELLAENRGKIIFLHRSSLMRLYSSGISWSIGGDYTFSKMLSLPNILRQYNPKLTGFSEQTSLMNFNDQNGTHHGLNFGEYLSVKRGLFTSLYLAEPGDHSIHLSDQAELLIDRLRNGTVCNWNDDWKIITISVGVSDLPISLFLR